MPYSERDEIPASWKKAGVKVENDPSNIRTTEVDGVFLHRCSPLRRHCQDSCYHGILSPQFKHGDSYWFCSHCKTVVSPQMIMAIRLAV